MTLSDQELRARLAAQQWTSHNIRLSDAITTMPGQPDFLETDLRLQAIMRAISLLFRNGFRHLRVADLGCLEGGFALALAKQGVEVTGIEARRKNFEKVKLLQDHFGFENLNFQLDDVKNFTLERYGRFDVTLALGILYHLDDPVAWLKQIAPATRGLLIIDSHYAPPDDASLKLIDKRLALGSLKAMKDREDLYEGRWFFEYDDKANREDQLWASYSNNRSFWLTKESLLKATMRAGFDLLFEQHDYSVDSYQHLTITFPRTMLLAIKSNAFAST